MYVVIALLNIYPMYAKYSDTDRPGPKVVKLFSCSTQLKFIMIIKVEIHILTFISGIITRSEF